MLDVNLACPYQAYWAVVSGLVLPLAAVNGFWEIKTRTWLGDECSTELYSVIRRISTRGKKKGEDEKGGEHDGIKMYLQRVWGEMTFNSGHWSFCGVLPQAHLNPRRWWIGSCHCFWHHLKNLKTVYFMWGASLCPCHGHSLQIRNTGLRKLIHVWRWPTGRHGENCKQAWIPGHGVVETLIPRSLGGPLQGRLPGLPWVVLSAYISTFTYREKLKCIH